MTSRLVTGPFVALWIAALAFFTAGGLVVPVSSRFAQGSLALDGLGIGVGIGAFSVAALLMRPVVGWAADTYGRKPLLVFGGALTVVALIAHLAVDSLPMFIAVRSLLGVAEAFFFVAVVTAVSDLAPVDRRGEALNLGSLAVYIGLGVGPFLGEVALDLAGYTGAWLLAAGIAVVAAGLSLFVPETAPRQRDDRSQPRPRTKLIHPAGVLPGIFILTGTWGMAGYFAFIPLHADAVGLDGAGPLLALYAVVVIGLRIAFAKLPDRVGAVRLSGSALVMTAVGLVVIGLVDGVPGLVVGSIAFAAGVAFMFPALMAVAVARVSEDERGAVVGTTSAFLDVSFGLAPAILGALVGSGGYGGTFVISGVIALAGAVGLVALRDRMRPPVSAMDDGSRQSTPVTSS